MKFKELDDLGLFIVKLIDNSKKINKSLPKIYNCLIDNLDLVYQNSEFLSDIIFKLIIIELTSNRILKIIEQEKEWKGINYYLKKIITYKNQDIPYLYIKSLFQEYFNSDSIDLYLCRHSDQLLENLSIIHNKKKVLHSNIKHRLVSLNYLCREVIWKNYSGEQIDFIKKSHKHLRL